MGLATERVRADRNTIARPAVTDHDCIDHALAALRLARDYLKEAGASARCIARVRAALSSAKGAQRHVSARQFTCPRCGQQEAKRHGQNILGDEWLCRSCVDDLGEGDE